MQVSTILGNIDVGGIALPTFQRGYVWNRDQVRALIDSLYGKYPVGGPRNPGPTESLGSYDADTDQVVMRVAMPVGLPCNEIGWQWRVVHGTT